jgi:hypothetical protein
MKYTLILFIAMAWSATIAQVPYFNLQIDNQRRADGSGAGVIETADYYLLSLFSGTGGATIADSSYVVIIDKMDASYYLQPINQYKGVICGGFHFGSGKPILEGQYHEGLNSPNEKTAFFCFYDPLTGEVGPYQSFGWPERGEYPYRPISTSDGGYFTAGWSFQEGGYLQQVMVYKCDSNLQQQYLKLLPANPPTGTHVYFGGNAHELPNGDIICVGTHRKYNNLGLSRDDALTFKLNPQGNVAWWKEFPSTGDTLARVIYDIKPKPDGTFLCVGTCTVGPEIGKKTWYSWTLGLDQSGNILWQKYYAPNNRSGWQGLATTPDGNFVTVGYERDNFIFDANNEALERQYATVSKLDPEGNLLWHRRYTIEKPNKLFDIFFDVLPTSDGGLLCNGTTYLNDSTYQEAWVIKLDSLGCAEPGCDTVSGVMNLPVGRATPFTLSPNPTTGPIRIEVTDGRPIERVTVWSQQGGMVWQGGNEGSHCTVDLAGRPAGTYLFAVQVGGVVYVRQVVLVR